MAGRHRLRSSPRGRWPSRALVAAATVAALLAGLVGVAHLSGTAPSQAVAAPAVEAPPPPTTAPPPTTMPPSSTTAVATTTATTTTRTTTRPAPPPRPARPAPPPPAARPAPPPPPPPPPPPAPRRCPTELKGTRPHVAQVGNHIAQKFGVPLSAIGGYRRLAVDRGGHPAGLAIDWTVGRAKGDAIADYLLANRGRMAVRYVIWRQRISFGAGWDRMNDRGSVTANHFDHVHASFGPGPVDVTC